MVLPEGFVYLNDVCPTIREEIFYATKHNFVGEPIDGYKVKNVFNPHTPVAQKIVFFSSISFVRISYKTIWLKTWSWYKIHWKMKDEKPPHSQFSAQRAWEGEKNKFDLTIVFIFRRRGLFWLKELLRCFNTRKRSWKNKGSGYAFGMPTGKKTLQTAI